MSSLEFMHGKFPGKASGYTVRAACPFCNHKNAFHWHTKGTNPWKCHACGETGNAFTLGYRDREFKKSEIDPIERFLWNRRKKFGKPWRLSSAVISEFNLKLAKGISTKGKIVEQLEIKDSDENTQKILRWYIKAWIHPGGKDKADFWLNKNRAARKGYLFIVAGEWDLFALWEKTGIHGISPRNGENSIPNDTTDLKILNGRDIVIAYDNDPTGRANARRLSRFILSKVKINSIKILDMQRLGCPPAEDIDFYFNELKGTKERFFEEIENLAGVESTEAIEADFLNSIPRRTRLLPNYANPVFEDGRTKEIIWRASILQKNYRNSIFKKLAIELGSVQKKGTGIQKQILVFEQEAKAMNFQALDDLVKEECEKLKLTAEEKNNDFISESVNYYKYGRGVYVPFLERDIILLCDKIAREITPRDDRHRLSQVKKHVEEQLELHKSQITPAKFNNDKNLVNFRNGIIDTRTGKILKHSPFYKITFQLNIDYFKEADCPNFKDALSTWFADKETKNEFLKMLYYVISGDRSAQVAFFWHGEGGDGKGEAARILRDLIGEERTSAINIEDLDNRFMIGQLYNKMLNIADEVGRKTKINDSRFKNVTGNSLMTADIKYGKIITFESMAQWIILTNNMPSSSDNSRGFSRRLKFLKFEHIPKEKKIENFYKKKLKGELSGIINYALTKGKELYKKEGFLETETEKEAKENLLRKNSVNNYWIDKFENEGEKFDEGVLFLEVTNGGKHKGKKYIYPAQFYKNYTEFCKEGGFMPANRENFQQDSKNQIERLVKEARRNYKLESAVIRLEDSFSGKRKPCRVLLLSKESKENKENKENKNLSPTKITETEMLKKVRQILEKK